MSGYAGWLFKPFRLGREVSEKEVRANLRSPEMPRLRPLSNGLIHLDPICLEYVDRYFPVRGGGVLGGAIVVVPCLVLLGFIIDIFLQQSGGQSARPFWSLVIFVMMFGVPALVAMKWFVLKDAFRYTHYPVRFNRMNRKVYVFTGGARKCLEVPFDEAFFFINGDKNTVGSDLRTYDLRMHIIEGGKIIHTASIGYDSGAGPGVILAQWEMIRRFMDEGMESLPFPPLGIVTSTRVSLKNAMILSFATAPGPLRWIMAPFLILMGIARYIALVTSNRPAWPRSVEAECKPPPGARVLHEPLIDGDLPGGDMGEAAYVQYWKEALVQAKAQDAHLVRLLNGEVK